MQRVEDVEAARLGCGSSGEARGQGAADEGELRARDTGERLDAVEEAQQLPQGSDVGRVVEAELLGEPQLGVVAVAAAREVS